MHLPKIKKSTIQVQKKNCARKKITELKFATWISQFAEIAKLNIANEQIFMGIAELKNAKY